MLVLVNKGDWKRRCVEGGSQGRQCAGSPGMECPDSRLEKLGCTVEGMRSPEELANCPEDPHVARFGPS